MADNNLNHPQSDENEIVAQRRMMYDEPYV